MCIKTLFRYVLATLLAVTGATALQGCSEHDCPMPPPPAYKFHPTTVAETRTTIPTYFSGGHDCGLISDVITKRFIAHSTQEEAELCIYSNDEIPARIDEIDQAYRRGAMIMILEPEKAQYDMLVRLGHPDMYAHPDDKPIFYAYDIFTEYISSGDHHLSDETLAIMTSENKPLEGYSYEYDWTSDRFDHFVNWLNERENAGKSRRGSAPQKDGSEFNTDINISAVSFQRHHDYGESLDHYIVKAAGSNEDRLTASWSTLITFTIHPVYMYERNVDPSMAGDYYIVEADITLHNGELFQCKKNKHGAIHTYMVGFFMEKFHTDVTLTDNNGNTLGNNQVRFYMQPIPDNQNASQSHTYGSSHSFNGSISAGKQGQDFTGSVSLGYSGTWSTSMTYETMDVQTIKNTDAQGRVKYDYVVQNIRDSFWSSDFDKYVQGNGIPLLSRADCHLQQKWIWHVPVGVNGVKDGSETNFKMKLNASGTIGERNWFSGGHLDKHHFDKQITTSKNPAEFTLPALHRKLFGVLSVKNDTPYTMGHVRIWKKGTAYTADPVAEISGSYNKEERPASIILDEGEYNIRYDLIDGATNIKQGTWQIEGITIRQGRTQEESTTKVSSIDATRI